MAAQKTTVPKKEQIVKTHYLVDAEGKTLGRMAAKIAAILRGKNKATFTPFLDTGDHVIVINAEKVRVTGKKTTDKFYDRYSGFHSGLKSIRFSDMIKNQPCKVIELAIRRMIPAGKLGARQKMNLYVYAGPDHPHKAQKPVPLDV